MIVTQTPTHVGAPTHEVVDHDDACPGCGEARMDKLVWRDDDSDTVDCLTCGCVYRPGYSGPESGIATLETAVLIRQPDDEDGDPQGWRFRSAAFGAESWTTIFFKDAAEVLKAGRALREQTQQFWKNGFDAPLPSFQIFYGLAYGCQACPDGAHFYQPDPAGGFMEVACGYCGGRSWVR